MKRLLLDQGLARSTAVLLRSGGWDVLHVSEIGMSRADDSEIRKEGLNATAVTTLLQAIWPKIEDALTRGALVTVTERSIRIRRLPILRP